MQSRSLRSFHHVVIAMIVALAPSCSSTQLQDDAAPPRSDTQDPQDGGSDGGGDSGTAAEFVAGLGLGVNIERGNAYNMGDFGSGTVGYAYLKALGFTHVRLFYAFRPTINFGQSGGLGIAPTRDEFARILRSAHHANDAGLKVFLDLTDVMGQQDFEGDFQALVDGFVEMASKAIAEDGFDPSMLAVGAVNEWEGGDNPSWNPQRIHMLELLRANLPGFVLTTGSANWKYHQQLMQDDFEMSNDDRVLYEVHAYDGGANEAGYWTDLSAKLHAWSIAHGHAAYIMGESGPGAWDGTPAGWAHAVGAAADQGHGVHPSFWAITGGQDLRMNVAGDDYHLDPAVESAVH